VEVVEAAWSVAWERARELTAAGKPTAPVYFHLGDLMNYETADLPDATHV
jgi:hypothetical protein